MMRIYCPCLLFCSLLLRWWDCPPNPPRDISSLITVRGLEQSMHQTEVAWVGLTEITLDWALMRMKPLRESLRN